MQEPMLCHTFTTVKMRMTRMTPRRRLAARANLRVTRRHCRLGRDRRRNGRLEHSHILPVCRPRRLLLLLLAVRTAVAARSVCRRSLGDLGEHRHINHAALGLGGRQLACPRRLRIAPRIPSVVWSHQGLHLMPRVKQGCCLVVAILHRKIIRQHAVAPLPEERRSVLAQHLDALRGAICPAGVQGSRAVQIHRARVRAAQNELFDRIGVVRLARQMDRMAPVALGHCDARARAQKQQCKVREAIAARNVQRGVALAVLPVDQCAVLEKHLGVIDLVQMCRNMQWAVAAHIDHIRIRATRKTAPQIVR
eukprot:comp20114_c0_seq1/m.39633 comp20114_c0_seq1/g.39633  ORF comp20114_c0_seq1/g.39633 comp20114_c0_seq1/m.39633 type:complete len:308 (+) comp20114_c0_seq1:281-1204(+)